jgi:hypothetical protein
VDEPADPKIDPEDDGLALVLELERPATTDDLDAANAMLEEWLAPYEGDDPRYRNSNVEGDVDARELVVWADRIRDPDGAEAAIERLSSFGESAKEKLPVKSWRIESAPKPADVEKPPETQPISEPGDTAAREEAEPEKRKAPLPSGLRPGIMWLVPILIARLAARGVEGTTAIALASGGTLIGVMVLAIASRNWCRPIDHALAALAVLASGAHLALALLHPEMDAAINVLRWIALLTAIGWAYLWLSRAPSK